MQFLILAHDYTDSKGLERRMAARQQHISASDKLRDEGKMLYGASILNDQEKMIGSVIVYDFKDRAALDEWLKREPYVTGKVWEKIEIRPCRVGPSFQKLASK